MQNLYGSPSYAKVQADLKNKLGELKQRYQDTEPAELK